MPLSDHLTLSQPLGPHNQSLVRDPRDAAELLADVAPFIEALRDHASIIIGRRGSGKSSVLHGYRSDIRFGHPFGRFDADPKQSRDIVIPLLNWLEFHLMATRVGRELNFMLRDNPDKDFLFDATISDVWQYFIWEAIFNNLNGAMKDGRLANDEQQFLRPVFEFFSLASIESTDIANDASQKLVYAAQLGLMKYLNARNKLCYVFFDNLDDYPIRNPLIETVVSGFLKAVHDINENYPRLKIIICIPEEIETYLQKESHNIEKDFTAPHRMRWKPFDLLRIVAYRYRCFMEIHDNEFFQSIAALDLSSRKGVVELFGKILPRDVMNSLGYKEPALPYIIRHTQLLPRHFIILFNAILIREHMHSGGFRSISEDSIIAGVAESEKTVAAQILKPYEEIYPKLIKSAKILLGNLPVICNESDLDRIGARFKERVEDDVNDIWSALHEIGIVGMLDSADVSNAAQERTGPYLYASWSYNSNVSFAKTDRQHYCIHPIFSRYYGLVRNQDTPNMALYPRDVPSDWE